MSADRPSLPTCASCVVAIPDEGEDGPGWALPVDDLRDVLLDFRDAMVAAGDAYRRHVSDDGGLLGYMSLARAVQQLTASLPVLTSEAATAGLTHLLSDLNAVLTGRAAPPAFTPRQGGSTTRMDVAYRNTVAAAALELLMDVGRPASKAAAEIARRLVAAGHTRDARGSANPHENQITGATVRDWRKDCLRTKATSLRVLPAQFESLVAARAEDPTAGAEGLLQQLTGSEMFARHRGGDRQPG